MLLPYVEKDTGAFYNADEFKTGYETLKQPNSSRISRCLPATLT